MSKELIEPIENSSKNRRLQSMFGFNDESKGFTFLYEDIFPRNAADDLSDDSRSLLEKVGIKSLDRRMKERKLQEDGTYERIIPSGLPSSVGRKLVRLLGHAEDISWTRDADLKEKARILCDEGIRATNGLMEKRLAHMRNPSTSTTDAVLIEDAKTLCGLLEQGVWALQKLLDERRANRPAPDESGQVNQAHVPSKKPVQVNTRASASPQNFTRLSADDRDAIRKRLLSSIKIWLPEGQEQGEKYLVRSPFRSDKSPGSFIIYPDGRAFDFATKEKFDVIDIFAKINNLSTGDALRSLAEKYGVISNKSNVQVPSPKASPNVVPNAFPLPSAAFFVHSEHGLPSQTYCYKDLQGRVIGFVARYETPDQVKKKHFCPFSIAFDAHGKPGWKKSSVGWKNVPPIYGLEKLKSNPEKSVGIVEGEKAVAAASELFPNHVVLTWQGGTSNAAKADWGQLLGRVVDFIWPDADHKLDKKTGELLPLHQQPGMKAACEIAAELAKVGVNTKIVLPPAGVDDGWDLADALDEGWTSEMAQAHLASHMRDVASILSESEQAAPKQVQPVAQSDIKWRANDIIADLRIKFDQEIEQGTFESTFPFAANFRNFKPAAAAATRAASPILVSVSDQGQVTIVPSEIFVDKFVRWYDSTGRLDYGQANLSDDQLRTLGNRLALRLPLIEGEPLIFKKTNDPGHAWHLLDIESNKEQDEFKALPISRFEAEQFAMEFLSSKCPYWHEQLSRMNNRLAFLCYIGSTLDLRSKPQQYLWMHGDGQDGKSSILKVLKKVFGGAALVTDWPSHPNNFYTSRFEGRRLLLVDEEPGGICVRSDLWKRITGSDTISIEPKGKQPYEIRNNLLIIVGSNFRPSTKAKKADLRRLIICDVKTFDGIPFARFDEHLLEEFSDFMSLCQILWDRFKGISDLAPVDVEVTRQNLEEVNGKISEFIFENFEIMNIGNIKKALVQDSFAKKEIPHTPNRELEKACKAECIDFGSFRDYLIGFLNLIPSQVSYSKMDNPRVLFGLVMKPTLRKKLGLLERSFELWPAFSRTLNEPSMAE